MAQPCAGCWLRWRLDDRAAAGGAGLSGVRDYGHEELCGVSGYAESVRKAVIGAAVYLDGLTTSLDIITMAPLLTVSAEDAYVEFDRNAYKPFFVP